MRPLVIALLLSVASPFVFANDEIPERGWFWGRYIPDLEPKEEDEPKRENYVLAQPAVPDAEVCKTPEGWKPNCGFVDPKGNFDFQSQQRDALIQQAAMNPNDTKSVREWQKYNSWAVNQALTMARMWEWNMLQDQSLNPFISNPVSSFGIRAALDQSREKKRSVMEQIVNQGGFLVWFTRQSCSYCKAMEPIVKRLSESSGLTVFNAALDGQCMDSFLDACHTEDWMLEGARGLGIEAVPDLWLYLEQDDLWFRISSGVETVSTIESRIEVFFGAIIRAAKTGLAQADGSIPVDFNVRDMFDKSNGGLGEGF